MNGTNITPPAVPVKQPNFIVRLWRWFWRPPKLAWGLRATVFFVSGILFWGGFNWELEATNTEKFCTSCHEMQQNVYLEYRNTVHYSNKTGARGLFGLPCAKAVGPQDGPQNPGIL